MRRTRAMRGFTLIELLVALLVMALLAGMGWQVINTLYLSDRAVRERSEPLQRWQTALAQWQTDLDMAQTPNPDTAIEFNGLVLRWVRQAPDPAATQPALVVVAWAPFVPLAGQAATPGAHWMRWQSPAVTTGDGLQEAWAAAGQWAASQGRVSLPQAQVHALVPVQDWQLYFHRKGSWINPQSTQERDMPDGIRLQLTWPTAADGTAPDTLTLDWINSLQGGGKSQ